MQKNNGLAILVLLLAVSCGIAAQQRAKSDARTEAMVQDYLRMGFTESAARQRVASVIESESKVQLRTTTYAATPVAGSIWLDRDSITGAPNASHAHNFTPEEFVKDIFVKGGRAIADQAIKNVTLISSTWNGSMTDTWNDMGIMGPFGGDVGTWTGNDRELLYFDHGDTSTVVPNWDNSGTNKAWGMYNGFLLATGPGLLAEGTNDYIGGDLNNGYLLANLTAMGYIENELGPTVAPNVVRTYTSLEFDFKSFTDSVSFEYIFCSEEFPNYSNNTVNDAFGFFVSGPGLTDQITGLPADTINIAIYPATPTLPTPTYVSINTSNWGYRNTNTPATWAGVNAPNPLDVYPNNAVKPELHVPNYMGAALTEYDGHSVVMAAKTRVQRGQWYHLKLVIGNVSDTAYGSGTFLQAGSLDLGAPESFVPHPYVQTPYDSIYGWNSVYCGCENSVIITFDSIGGVTPGTLDVWTEGSGAASVYSPDLGEYFKNKVTYTIAPSDTMVIVNYMIDDTDLIEGSTFAFFSQLPPSPLVDTTSIFTLYKKSVQKLINFQTPAPLYAGKLEISSQNGSPYMQRTLNNGYTWEFVRDPSTGESVPFTQGQIAQLTEMLYDTDSVPIIYREPNTCYPVDTVWLKGGSGTLPYIIREVIIPEVPGVITNPGAGTYRVVSTENFTFTMTIAAKYIGYEPRVTTSRTKKANAKVTEKEDVIITLDKTRANSYTVIIPSVQETVVIYIDGPDVSAAAPVVADKVWVDDNGVIITSSVAGKADIYSVSGLLIGSLPLSPGATITKQLPKGFYIVSANGKAYKIVVK